uniref:Myosin IXB n=1 Tax=Lates calcarifer TaxID=8187 RepID=A0A4W6FSV2_LATCA
MALPPWQRTQVEEEGESCLFESLHFYELSYDFSLLSPTSRVQKDATAASVISDAATALGLDPGRLYVLAEVKESGGEEWVLEAGDLPVQRFLLWPRKAQEEHPQSLGFYFLLQERNHDGSIHYVHLPPVSKEQEAQRLAARGFLPPPQDDFADLCNLPVLNEDRILNNLRTRFYKKKIYTYAGSILIAINPFKFLPIYNPKYVKMYENHQLGKLEPHIFAIADVAYYAMLRKRVNQCIVISGESGSGKTQSTNFLIHCLTALSQKGYASGVERTILGAGPVLEAFGNAKTAHNNNSSRFVINTSYMLVYVCLALSTRNYHVFYYLLLGASEEERKEFKLLPPEEYFYLKQQNFKIEDEEDLRHDFERLQQAMEMVGFLPATKKQIFSVLSAILYLGNVTYRRKSTGRDEGLDVGPPEILATLSDLLKVKEELLVEALTKRKTVTVNDKLILPYSQSEAITARDSMAKSLYSALFDWIVLRINHALLNKKDMEESVPCLSIGVLDIFGFEDFETNSFEQFCINYANEQLQYYFNHHIFNLEQEEYQAEGITWHNIDYTDNVGCIHLISKKPTGLLYLLDEESNFPHATDETLLAKFKQQHQGNKYFVPTPVMEPAFVIRHFAGKVKYQIKDFREKNTDHMRPDIVALLRSSDRAYVRQLIGMDPVAMFRWGILRATIRGIAAFNEAGRSWAAKTSGVVRPISRTPLGELQRSNAPIERMYKDMHAEIISSIKNLQLDGEDPRKLLQSWGRLRFPRHVLQKNKTTKQKQVIPKSLLDSRSLKFIVSLTLHDRTTKSLLHLHKKKKPPSISAQFQTSLTKLLETLNRAEPFFIRCIRSNAEKKEMYLDEALVVQQLRYTGMLETVRIRRSGYGAKYTFQEFIEQFRVLLPKTATACKEDISVLLDKKMGLDPTTYQIGKTKVFLKELERQQLQDTLHKDVIRKIIFLQRWFRACLQRKEFMDMRQAAILIQRSWRRYCKEERRQHAATLIQAVWRGHRQRLEYHRQRQGATKIQALVRGHSARRSSHTEEEEQEKDEELEDEDEELNLETNGTAAEAGPQPDEKEEEEDLDTRGLPSDGVTSNALTPTSPGKASDKQAPSTTSTPSKAEQNRVRPPANRGQSSRSQEKREQRRRRGLEHNQRETDRAASSSSFSSAIGKDQTSPPKSKSQESPKLKERSDSKELDQYTFVAWKMKEDKGGKKEAKTSPPPPASGPVRPSTLSLQPADPAPERNGLGEGGGAVNLQRRPGAIKEKPEKWRGRRSNGEYSERNSPPPPHNREERRKKQPLSPYIIYISTFSLFSAPTSGHPSRPLSQPHSDRKGVGRNPSIKISRATRVSEQWNASLDREITNANELRHLDEFLGNQSLSATEAIFVTATMQFRENIKAMYSLTKPTIGYKALMTSYQNKVIHLASDKQKGEVQLVVNLFQSVLDGFIRGEMKKEEAEPAKVKTEMRFIIMHPLDHGFVNYQVNIMQSCDQCSSYIWGMEKAYMCSYCKMVCHKKCILKSFCSFMNDEDSGGQHFGVRVCHLVSDKNPVPMVLEMMLEHVEMHGLYTEGIYRKSGSANRIKELHQRLETDPHQVCLEDYPIHTVTGLVKQWLRELPDPLMTFTHYNDFLHAVELPEKQEQLHAIYKTLEELPTANFNTLERLVFHLVRVCKDEAHNRMSPNSLAIVFAPCILRCPDSADPLLSMKDVAKTTTCLEMLINEQIRRYNEKMEEIEQLEYAEALAVNQLKLKRQNTHYWHLPLRFSAPYKGVHEKVSSDLSVVPENEPLDSDTEAEKNLVERIKSIKQEKEDLACRLPEMEQPGSDQENLDSEASLSSESLLDEQQRSSAHSSEPVCPPKPPDLAQRPKILIGRVSLSNLTPASSTSSVSSCASSTSESSSASLRHLLQRRNPVIPDTVKLPPGVLSQSAASSLAQTYTPPMNRAFKNVVRRREQPGRRKDSTQSLYIDSPECDLLLHFSSCPPSGQRRFSDPDIPYAEEDV